MKVIINLNETNNEISHCNFISPQEFNISEFNISQFGEMENIY